MISGVLSSSSFCSLVIFKSGYDPRDHSQHSTLHGIAVFSIAILLSTDNRALEIFLISQKIECALL
jgi:hypothetical protein